MNRQTNNILIQQRERIPALMLYVQLWISTTINDWTWIFSKVLLIIAIRMLTRTMITETRYAANMSWPIFSTYIPLLSSARKTTSVDYVHCPTVQHWRHSWSLNPRRIAVNPNPNVDLWPLNPKPCHCRISRSFPIPSLNTLGSFVFELCSGETDRQTNRQTR